MSSQQLSTGSREIVGRTQETSRLQRLIQAAASGDKRAAFLVGTAGIGKTTLLRWTFERARDAGMIGAFVRAPATAGLPPHFPIPQFLEGLAQDREATPPDPVARVLATLQGKTTTDDYPAQLPQLVSALESLYSGRPLALFLDDLHWAPSHAVQLLLSALRVLEIPLLFGAAARSARTEAALPEPSADLWIEFVDIPEFNRQETELLASQLLGTGSLPSLVDALHEQTGGNPLYVLETLRAWDTRGELVRVGPLAGLAIDSSIARGQTLEDAIRVRAGQLGKDSLLLLGTLAVFGRDVSFREVATAGGLGSDQTIALLGRLVDDDFAVEVGPGLYRVRHPLVETSIRGLLGETRLGLIHERVYAALMATSASGQKVPHAELAHHAATSLTPPAELVELLQAAASEAHSAGSYREAAFWYGRLAKATPHGAESYLLAQARAAMSFDPRWAEDLLTELIDQTPAADDQHSRAELLHRRAEARRILGKLSAAAEDLRSGLPLVSGEERFEMQHMLGYLRALAGNLDEGERILLDLAGGTVDPENTHSKVLGHLGSFAFARSDLLEARQLWSQALARNPDHGYRVFLEHNLGWVCMLTGEWDRALELTQKGIDECVRSGDTWDLVALLATAARLRAWQGKHAESVDLAWRAVKLAPRLENVSCRIDSLDALGVALLESREPEHAIGPLREATQLMQKASEEREFSFTFAVLAEASALVGDVQGAEAALRESQRCLAGARFWEIAVDRSRALVDIRIGQTSSAIARLRGWVDRDLMPYEHARVLDLLGRTLFDIGKRKEGIVQVERAEEVFASLDASSRLQGARAWLSEARTRRSPGRPRSNGLTPREREVLMMVGHGKTNREIAEALTVSVGTVKKHVEHLIAKTGSARRTDLARIATLASASPVGALDSSAQ